MTQLASAALKAIARISTLNSPVAIRKYLAAALEAATQLHEANSDRFEASKLSNVESLLRTVLLIGPSTALAKIADLQSEVAELAVLKGLVEEHLVAQLQKDVTAAQQLCMTDNELLARLFNAADKNQDGVTHRVTCYRVTC